MARVFLLVLALGALVSWGCAKAQPIVTPPEYDAACRADAAGGDAACVTRVCAVYQAVVTDYYENMEGCRAACKQRANELQDSAPALCGAKVNAARDACLDFCQRKFYRCNCAK